MVLAQIAAPMPFYHPVKGKVVESRYVTFLEISRYHQLPAMGLQGFDEQESYAKNVADHTSSTPSSLRILMDRTTNPRA